MQQQNPSTPTNLDQGTGDQSTPASFQDPKTLPLDERRLDLVFGLVGPIGTDLGAVTEQLKANLKRFQYEPEVISLTHELTTQLDHPRWRNLPNKTSVPRDQVYHAYMDAGNCLRETTERADAMAALAIVRMRKHHAHNIQERFTATERAAASGEIETQTPMAAPIGWIIRQLKTPDEIALLRTVYGPRFLAISVYAPLDRRRARLTREIADSHHSHKTGPWEGAASELMWRDQEERETPWGQNIAHAFPMGDVFLDATDNQKLTSEVHRLFDLLFDNPYITPTSHEHAMALAHRAGFRSSDLSRQIGAAITLGPTQSVIAVGCNEVPRSGGGQYWPGDSEDNRDFQRGENTSYKRRVTVLEDTIRNLLENGWQPPEGKLPQKPADEAGQQEKEDYFRKLHELVRTNREQLLNPSSNQSTLGRRLLVEDIIEFARAVHAEMAAIMDAVYRGVSVRQATLYTTTFPCHECARHIVASGIKEVQYIEPYPKSLVEEFHSDAISIDANPNDGRVWFHPYVGISPSRYNSFFSNTRRTGAGHELREWNEESAQLRQDIFAIAQGDNELDAHSRRSEIYATMYRESHARNDFVETFARAIDQKKGKGTCLDRSAPVDTNASDGKVRPPKS